MSEFGEVFPDEIPGLPPAREIDFSIELVLYVRTWVTLVGLRELWEQRGLVQVYGTSNFYGIFRVRNRLVEF